MHLLIDELAAGHGDRLLRAAWLLCRDSAEARDLVQETFLAAIRGQSTYRNEGQPFTWLYGILRNIQRSRRRRSWRMIFPGQLPERECPQPGPEFFLDRQTESGRLVAALAELPMRHREVMLLRYVEELKIVEIASLLALAPGTVKSRLHYATCRLRRRLKQERRGHAPLGGRELS